MTDQKIKDMQPLDAALAIFAALPAEFGFAHMPKDGDQWGYHTATVKGIPGALLNLTMRPDNSTGRGMFRAAISDSLPLGEGMFYGDLQGIESPSGNFTRDQTPAQAAKAIARRLILNGHAAGYVAAVRKRQGDKRTALQFAENLPRLFTAEVHRECYALGYPIPAGDSYTPASSSGAQAVSYTGAYDLKFYGRGMLPDVTIWGQGPESPAFVRISEGGDSISFAIAAKICALVAFDKQSRY